MPRQCLDCAAPVSRFSKGRCRQCAPKLIERTPEWRAKVAQCMKDGRKPHTKLNEHQVREIRTMEGPAKVAAYRFGVGLSAIHAIRNGTSWRNV